MHHSTKKIWSIDNPQVQISFKVKHLMISNVKGIFKEFGAIICTNGNDFLKAEIDFWLHLSSVDYSNAKRDEYLKSSEYFDVEHYDKVLFKALSLVKLNNMGGYELNGNLIIKNITKEIKLNVVFKGMMKNRLGVEKLGFLVKGNINRNDWV